MLESVMYIFEALFVTCVDIILPTSDTYSDLFLVIGILKTTNDEKEFIDSGVWAFFLSLPMIANIVFTL